MSQPLVAFCVPTFNHGKYLAQCIDSILAQNYNNIEIWIGDDCSTDQTPDIVGEYSTEHPSVHYIRNKCNMGMYFNADSLLRRPSSDYIVRLDADDYIHPNYATDLLSLMARYPQAGYAHSASQIVDEVGSHRECRKLFRFSKFHSADRALRDLSRGLKMCANAPLFRRTALQAINYLEGTPKSGGD
jgi:glycosyltransferase involved in cell wall biosynthesis